MAGLSAFGRIYRLSRLNSLTINQTCAVLGIPNFVKNRLKNYGDFFWPEKDRWDNIRSVGPAPWSPSLEDLLPANITGELALNQDIRGCLECFASGFHATVHQLPWVERCPWHNAPLVCECQCGRRFLWNARTSSNLLLQCVCGCDHFDRMAALQSLSTWPAPDIERCLRKLVIEAKALRKGEVLYSDGELAWNQAVAVARGTHIPEEFVITATVIPTEGENDRDIRQVILAWMGIQEPELDYGIPVLHEQSVALRTFGTTLLAQVDRHTTDKSSESSFADLKVDIREWTRRSTRYSPRPFEFDPVEDYDVIDPIFRNHVAAYDIGRRGLRLGKRLVARLIRLRAPETADPYERFEQRLARAIALVDSEVRLLAQVLSIIATHALMERWTFLAWRTYSKENGTMMSLEGHSVAALSSSACPSARMTRILPFPKFDRPQADQAGAYRNPTVERDQKGPRRYWSPPRPRRQDD